MPVLAFLIAVAYVPMISGAGVSPRWALISAVIPCMMFASPNRLCLIINPPILAPGVIAGGIFLIYATISMIWATVFWDALDQTWKFLLLGIVFYLGSQVQNMRGVYLGFGLGIAVNSVVMLVQRLGFDPLGGSGLFWNPNFAGEAAALAIAALFSERQWTVFILAWPSLVLSGARGAILGTACAFVAWVWSKSRYGALGICALALAGIAITLPMGKGSASILQRLDLWSDVVQGLTLFGHGVGSFAAAFPKAANHIDTLALKFDHAHNDVLEIAFELGFPGLLLFMVLILVALIAAKRTEFMVLAAFLVAGSVGFPLFEPATAFLAALCAGYACGGGNRLRYPAPDRRMDILCAGPLTVRVSGDGVSIGTRGQPVPAQS